MSDVVIRKFETLMAQSPGDNDLRIRWIMEKNKMGEATVETHYKLIYNGKYYSNASYSNPWTKTGTKFKSKHEAIKVLDTALKSKSSWKQKRL